MPRKNSPVAPGTEGRVALLGQGRDKNGKFQKAQPKPLAPLDPASLEDFKARKAEVSAQDLRFRPTDEEWDVLGQETKRLYDFGYSVSDIAKGLDLPLPTIRRALAHVMAEKSSTQSREKVREWGRLRLEEIVQDALLLNDPDVARKAVMDLLRAYQLVSTGGNVLMGVQINQKSEDEVGDAVRLWISRERGELVEANDGGEA